MTCRPAWSDPHDTSAPPSLQKYEAALARAIQMRQEAEAAYQRDVTRAKRAEGRKLKAERKTG